MNLLRSSLTHAFWANFSTECRKQKKSWEIATEQRKKMCLLTWSGEKEIVTKKNGIFDLKWRKENDKVAAGSARTGGLLVVDKTQI